VTCARLPRKHARFSHTNPFRTASSPHSRFQHHSCDTCYTSPHKPLHCIDRSLFCDVACVFVLNQNMSSIQTVSVTQLILQEEYRKAFAYCISKTPFVVRSGSRMGERKMQSIFRVVLDEVITINYTEAQLLELCSGGVIEDEAAIKVHTCFVRAITRHNSRHPRVFCCASSVCVLLRVDAISCQ
jgi:hypothetical protein